MLGLLSKLVAVPPRGDTQTVPASSRVGRVSFAGAPGRGHGAGTCLHPGRDLYPRSLRTDLMERVAAMTSKEEH